MNPSSKQTAGQTATVTSSPSLSGFMDGYVAGNIQYGSSIIASHVSALIDSMEKLKDTYPPNMNTSSTISIDSALYSLRNVNPSLPIQALELLKSALFSFRNALEEAEFVTEPKRKDAGKRIIYHYLSLAKQIKDSGFTNTVTQIAEANQGKILDNAA